MSLRPSDSDDLEKTLASTRRNVRQLEMDTCRIRNDLTRLEVALESGIPNLRREASQDGDDERVAVLHSSEPLVHVDAPHVVPEAVEFAPFESIESPTSGPEPVAESAAVTPFESEPVETELTDIEPSTELAAASIVGSRARRTYLYVTSPAVVSVLLHAAIVLLIVSISVATIVNNKKPFAATFVDVSLGEKPPEQLDTSFDLGKPGELDETAVDDALVDGAKLDLAGPVVDDVMPVDFETATVAASIGDAGLMTALATDLGMELPGNGGTGPDGAAPATGISDGKGTNNARRGGGGRGAGGQAAALFFGTKAKGDRFVFVIDNSSSMKNGRLEMALAELVKTVEGMSAKQSFYVIFVSDQPYPMFYPLPEPDMIPATPANKKRLVEWLPKVILASGKNRELIKAMDAAATLRPHAVYLLWDGDMKYSENVRLDVMTHLTAPGWNFTVHTIGMGLTSAESVQNLTAIAEAHGGMFRRVELPTARVR